jgi:hypothetical protein
VVAAAQGEGADAGVEGERGGELAVGFGEAGGGSPVAAPDLGVGEAGLALEAELVETVGTGLPIDSQVSVDCHIDILARILNSQYPARRLY